MSGDVRPALRVPLLIGGFIALASGVLGGLLRLGWSVPIPASTIPLHGPLLIGGFFGTVISLERAVAIGRGWAYLAPLACGLGGLAILFGIPGGAVLLTAGSLLLFGATLTVVKRQPTLFTGVLGLGALSWATGNLLWLGGHSLPEVIPCWIGFLVLTIAGERLELSRLLPRPPSATRLFVVIVLALAAAIALASISPTGGRLIGATLIPLAVWLLRYDIARRTVHERGLTRFIAVCLLSGYGWLLIAGGVGLLGGFTPGILRYDAALHSVFLGFVFAMVFGHAAIIFPAVLRVAIPYHPVFYLPLAALHLTLSLRVGGDLGAVPALRAAGGLGNAVTLALFILTMVASVLYGRVKKSSNLPKE